jgi:hypothetical protein
MSQSRSATMPSLAAAVKETTEPRARRPASESPSQPKWRRFVLRSVRSFARQVETQQSPGRHAYVKSGYFPLECLCESPHVVSCPS